VNVPFAAAGAADLCRPLDGRQWLFAQQLVVFANGTLRVTLQLMLKPTLQKQRTAASDFQVHAYNLFPFLNHITAVMKALMVGHAHLVKGLLTSSY